jgi:hypothetical protein
MVTHELEDADLRDRGSGSLMARLWSGRGEEVNRRGYTVHKNGQKTSRPTYSPIKSKK